MHETSVPPASTACTGSELYMLLHQCYVIENPAYVAQENFKSHILTLTGAIVLHICAAKACKVVLACACVTFKCLSYTICKASTIPMSSKL